MKIIVTILTFFAAAMLVSCGNKTTTTGRVSSGVATASAPAYGSQQVPAASSESRVSSIANREIIRRQEAIRRMDETALKASQAMAAGDLEAAVAGYEKASRGVR